MKTPSLYFLFHKTLKKAYITTVFSGSPLLGIFLF